VPGAADETSERARGYVATHASRLRGLGPGAATGDADAVHDARTATRRLRTALGVCRPLLPVDDPGAAAGLRELGRSLGAVRDADVQLAWLRAALDERDDDPRARARLEEDRSAARRAGLVGLRRTLGSPAHAALLTTLDSLAAQPWPPDEGRVAHRAARCWRRLARALVAADDAGPEQRDAALHAARRRARAARYACEVVGDDAALRRATLAERLQDALGAQHDAVLVRTLVAEVAARAGAAGEDTSTYAWLEGAATAAAERATLDAAREAERVLAAGHRHRGR
jgi:CHAD domain-containing protein